VPLWLPCQFLCCRVSHFLSFVCAGGCQARWNAAEVILGGRASAPAWVIHGLPGPPRAAAAGWRGLGPTSLLRLALAGLVCPAQGVEPGGHRGWGWRESALTSGLLSCPGTGSSLGPGRGPWSASAPAHPWWGSARGPAPGHGRPAWPSDAGLKVWPLAGRWGLYGLCWAPEAESLSWSGPLGTRHVTPELDMAPRICTGLNECQ